jgi:hypothetical protein
MEGGDVGKGEKVGMQRGWEEVEMGRDVGEDRVRDGGGT